MTTTATAQAMARSRAREAGRADTLATPARICILTARATEIQLVRRIRRGRMRWVVGALVPDLEHCTTRFSAVRTDLEISIDRGSVHLRGNGKGIPTFHPNTGPTCTWRKGHFHLRLGFAGFGASRSATSSRRQIAFRTFGRLKGGDDQGRVSSTTAACDLSQVLGPTAMACALVRQSWQSP